MERAQALARPSLQSGAAEADSAPLEAYGENTPSAGTAAATQRFLRRASCLQPLCLFHLCRLKMPTSPFRGCEWNAQKEVRTTAHFRLYVDAAVVQLQNAVGHGQADATTTALGRE